MNSNPPTPGVTVSVAEDSLTPYSPVNVADVVLGAHADAAETRVARVSLGRTDGSTMTSAVHFFTDADLAEELAHALMDAADHLRGPE